MLLLDSQHLASYYIALIILFEQAASLCVAESQQEIFVLNKRKKIINEQGCSIEFAGLSTAST